MLPQNKKPFRNIINLYDKTKQIAAKLDFILCIFRENN